jgi:ABC-type multidrug transport system ATPase subunit
MSSKDRSPRLESSQYPSLLVFPYSLFLFLPFFLYFLSGGRTVLAIIHQPRYEIFEQTLDIVILLSRGRIVFSGTPEEANSYFSSLGHVPPETCNPAEFFLEVISVDKSTVEELASNWELSKQQEPEIGT